MLKTIKLKNHRIIENDHGHFCEEFIFTVFRGDITIEACDELDRPIEDFFVIVTIPNDLSESFPNLNNTSTMEKFAFQRAKLEVKKAAEFQTINKHSEIMIRASDLQLKADIHALKSMESPENSTFSIEIEDIKVKRAYWHMQLHPNDPGFANEKEILKQKKVIGLGSWSGGEEQLRQFSDDMRVGDVVLIKRGSLALALTEVIGEYETEDKIDENLDWFENRRKVRILEINETQKNDFPFPRGTLRKATNPFTPTYQYIDAWYEKLRDSTTFSIGTKINSIKINDYKMFQNFELDFCNDAGNPSPVIVLAGVNGCGKTSLLEFIANFKKVGKNRRNDSIIFQSSGFSKYLSKDKSSASSISNLLSNVIYLPVDFGKTQNLKNQILAFIDEMILERDLRASEAYIELGNTIDEIFEGLNLKSQFSRVDKKKEIIFKNAGEKEFIIDELSTGEKTLLTKVLFLYLSKIRNKVILIDEPELSLHPSWQNRLLGMYEAFAEKNNNQIIIATHSPQIIAGTKREYLRLLTLQEGNVIVVESIPQSYGMKFDQVLFEIMGLTQSRTPKVEEKFERIKELLIENTHSSKEFKELWTSLENDICEDDPDLNLLKLELLYKTNEKNN